jgi:hypothetical protein
MKKTTIALLSILAINSTNAAELSIVGHGFSKHLVNHNFNERNYGAALRLEKDDFAVQAGSYRNSFYKDTVYAGFDWSPLHYNLGGCFNLDAGLYAGGATGYKYAVTPMAGVQAAVKCENVFVRVRAIPDPFFQSKAVGAIEFGLVLKKF